MEQALIDLYRCPESFVKFDLIGRLSNEAGYFRFGQDTICYGHSATGFRASRADGVLYDARGDVTTNGSNAVLTFNPTEVIEGTSKNMTTRNSGLANEKTGQQSGRGRKGVPEIA